VTTRAPRIRADRASISLGEPGEDATCLLTMLGDARHGLGVVDLRPKIVRALLRGLAKLLERPAQRAILTASRDRVSHRAEAARFRRDEPPRARSPPRALDDPRRRAILLSHLSLGAAARPFRTRARMPALNGCSARLTSATRLPRNTMTCRHACACIGQFAPPPAARGCRRDTFAWSASSAAGGCRRS
jgi:hypothetical protein